MEEIRNRHLRAASVFLAPGILLVVGFVTLRCMRSYLKGVHSALGVPLGTSILVLGLLVLLVIVGGYTSYRLLRFVVRGI